jgi:hypothetical protein
MDNLRSEVIEKRSLISCKCLPEVVDNRIDAVLGISTMKDEAMQTCRME